MPRLTPLLTCLLGLLLLAATPAHAQEPPPAFAAFVCILIGFVRSWRTGCTSTAGELRDAYVRYLAERLEAPRTFVEEGVRAR